MPMPLAHDRVLPDAAARDAVYQASRTLADLDLALQREPGHRLFTVLVIDWSRREHRRIYSSSPPEYPCGGAKPLQLDNDFFRQVVVAGTSRICTDRNACRAAFPDYPVFERLGCASAVNVPIRLRGITYGSLNLLHAQGWYRPDMLPRLLAHANRAAHSLCPAIPFLMPS